MVSYGEGWVKFSYSEEVDDSIVDMQGKTLQLGRIQNGEYTLETASMPTGLYTTMSMGSAPNPWYDEELSHVFSIVGCVAFYHGAIHGRSL